MFDAATFLNQTISGPMATSMTACPEGEWQCSIDLTGDPLDQWFGVAKWTDKKSGQEKTAPTLQVPILIVDQRVKDLLKRDTIRSRYRMFLDTTVSGQIDNGPDKNVKLGRLRAALDQNADPSWTFQKLWVPTIFIGKVAQNSDEKDPSRKYDEVINVTRLT
jgi:hypothetical protein